MRGTTATTPKSGDSGYKTHPSPDFFLPNSRSGSDVGLASRWYELRKKSVWQSPAHKTHFLARAQLNGMANNSQSLIARRVFTCAGETSLILSVYLKHSVGYAQQVARVERLHRPPGPQSYNPALLSHDAIIIMKDPGIII